MNIYKFQTGLRKRFILALLIIAFGSGSLCAQHLFSVNYDDLSQDNVNMIRTEIAKFNNSVSTMSMTKNRENKEVYSFSLSSVQNTKIIILNEETGNSVVITPKKERLYNLNYRRSLLKSCDRLLWKTHKIIQV